jgi:glycerol-3-phosphate acyltransferase PlsY
MLTVVFILLAYLLGSVPFGLLVARVAGGIDPRLEGSRNTGATNVSRLIGLRWGLLVLGLDIAKGWLPVYLAQASLSSHFSLGLIALAAIAGHTNSIFLHGKGGKAVATTVGVFLALTPILLLIALAACVAVILLSGYVSLGSLTLVTALPVLLLVSGKFWLFFFSLAVMCLVYWKHRENIARLARGEEKTWRKSAKI